MKAKEFNYCQSLVVIGERSNEIAETPGGKL